MATIKHYLNGSIDKSDLMVLINIVWNKLFACIVKNMEILLIEDVCRTNVI